MNRISKVLLAMVAGSQFLFASAVFAQSIEDNIRPVGQLCLAGQSCVGTTGGRTVSVAPSAAPAAVVETAATVADAPTAAVAATAAPAFDAAAAYQMSCFACHGTGAAGAPKAGDKEAWAARTEKGMDAVMTNVMNGLNAMPPKGLCMTCSDSDLRALVDYMVAQ